MKLDLQRYDNFAARGMIRQGSWGDGRKRACMMSAAVTGATSEEDCVTAGWPLWLAEFCVARFDAYPEAEAVTRGRGLLAAIADADNRGVDWDRVRRDLRMNAILPIALRSIGAGDEHWRAQCREAVQWSIDNDGADNPDAAGPAMAAWAAWAARAAEAAWAAGAAGAARAAEAAEAARAARAAAWDEIEVALIAAIKTEK